MIVLLQYSREMPSMPCPTTFYLSRRSSHSNWDNNNCIANAIKAPMPFIEDEAPNDLTGELGLG